MRAIVIAALAVGACGGEDPSPATVVTTALTARWDLVPHRSSFLEFTSAPDPDGRGATLVARNDGGPCAALDTAHVDQSFTVYDGEGTRRGRA